MIRLFDTMCLSGRSSALGIYHACNRMDNAQTKKDLIGASGAFLIYASTLCGVYGEMSSPLDRTDDPLGEDVIQKVTFG